MDRVLADGDPDGQTLDMTDVDAMDPRWGLMCGSVGMGWDVQRWRTSAQVWLTAQRCKAKCGMCDVGELQLIFAALCCRCGLQI